MARIVFSWKEGYRQLANGFDIKALLASNWTGGQAGILFEDNYFSVPCGHGTKYSNKKMWLLILLLREQAYMNVLYLAIGYTGLNWHTVTPAVCCSSTCWGFRYSNSKRGIQVFITISCPSSFVIWKWLNKSFRVWLVYFLPFFFISIIYKLVCAFWKLQTS